VGDLGDEEKEIDGGDASVKLYEFRGRSDMELRGDGPENAAWTSRSSGDAVSPFGDKLDLGQILG
jgi:hypothetical protein